MKTNILKSIVASLFRKKRKKESVLKYVMFMLHLWFGLLTGAVLSFVCITGALYIFKAEVCDFSAREYLYREAPAQSLVSTATVIDKFTLVYGDAPARIVISEDTETNIRVFGAGHGPSAAVAFADRETGEITGELSSQVSAVFMEIFTLHRWFSFEGKNRAVGRAIIGATSLLFIFLLISGVILWLPSRGKKNKWRNKFNIRFNYKFQVWNRDLHINAGAIASLFLIVITWTGIFFSYGWVRTLTIDTFNPNAVEVKQRPAKSHENKSPQGDKAKAGRGMQEKKYVLPNVDFDKLIADASTYLPYEGEVSLLLSGRGVSSPTVRKENTHNLLGAVLYDDVKYNNKGEFVAVDKFSERPLYKQIGSVVKATHTGEILGLKSKILYFILCLLAAYLPISGYIMWWKKIKV